MRAVALIDGDHTAEVVQAALAELPFELVGVIMVGGGEKLRSAHFDVPVVEGFGDAEIVVDLSDEPALPLAERFGWAARALAAGLPYLGADFRFDPPALEPIELPSIAVIGTGKRVGKTALTVHLARLLAAEREVVVVCMGRGGPLTPELLDTPPSLSELVSASRAGRHAASDYLEVALLAGVRAIGCRRAGGGLAGGIFVSNVREGARLAVEQRPDIVLFDASGAALPPIAVDRRVLVVGPAHELGSALNGYRRLIADLVVSIGCELEGAIPARLRLAPLGPLPGRVAVFTAGAADVSHIEADVVHVSAKLGDRAALRRELRGLEADTYLSELKGAAIDIVAEDALARGREFVLAGNDVVSDELDEALLALVPSAATT
jgi:cyclic 2,3-diphosphoglycerate synthetase